MGKEVIDSSSQRVTSSIQEASVEEVTSLQPLKASHEEIDYICGLKDEADEAADFSPATKKRAIKDEMSDSDIELIIYRPNEPSTS